MTLSPNSNSEPNSAELDLAFTEESLRHHNSLTPLLGVALGKGVARLLEITDGDRPIVEVGAGLGTVAEALSDHNPKLYSNYIQTELGQENCVIARGVNPEIPTVCAKVQELPFASGAIGTIIARNLFDMVSIEPAIEEFARVLPKFGQVMHLRDVRPNFAWTQLHMRPQANEKLIPYFDGTSTFQRYQTQDAKALELLAGGTDLHIKAADPQHQAEVSGGIQGTTEQQELRDFCNLAAPKRKNITPSFNQFMNRTLKDLFKRAGFHVKFITATGEAYVDAASAHAFIAELGLGPEFNTIQHADSYSHFGYDNNVPKGYFRVRYFGDTLIATKKR